MVSDLWKHLRSVFQSTLPRRERRHLQRCCKSARKFQSTLPRRERLTAKAYGILIRYFNPRSRGGSDKVSEYEKQHLSLFQSTLPRRERPRYSFHCMTHAAFQSTLPRRERQQLPQAPHSRDQFQSTLPRRERRRTVYRPVRRIFYFNPRSRGGSDTTRPFLPWSAG